MPRPPITRLHLLGHAGGCDVARLKIIDFICQRRSRQAHFTWHQDHDENGLDASMLSVIICLRGTGTGMQVWGCRVFEYAGNGAAAAFPGAATHRSVPRVAGCLDREEVVKVALFFE